MAQEHLLAQPPQWIPGGARNLAHLPFSSELDTAPHTRVLLGHESRTTLPNGTEGTLWRVRIHRTGKKGALSGKLPKPSVR
jgi:hypothetical protein